MLFSTGTLLQNYLKSKGLAAMQAYWFSNNFKNKN